MPDELEQAECRRQMVERQLRARGIRDPRVLAAMGSVPRHRFVAEEFAAEAYDDKPLPTADGQTISQPYMVASMTELLEISSDDRVLEIGVGSGYQSAVLSMLARDVHAVEIRPALAQTAQERLARLGYGNVHVHVGDGSIGWPDAGPYDAILMTAAAPKIPEPLLAQLTRTGRMVVPVGSQDQQNLVRARRRGDQVDSETLYQCRFVPLIGRYGWAQPPGQGPSADMSA